MWSIVDRAVSTHNVTISDCVPHWTYLFFPRFLVYRIRQVLNQINLQRIKEIAGPFPLVR